MYYRQRKQREVEKALAILCSQCQKKHPLRECPLNSCTICEQDHSTKKCPSLLGLKEIYKEVGEDVEATYFVGSKKPWKSRPPCMMQDYFSPFNSWSNVYNVQRPHQKFQYLEISW